MNSFKVTAFHYNHSELKSFEQVYFSESYDEVMSLFKKDLRKQGIHSNKIVSYKIIQTATCAYCNKEILLTNSTNKCSCGVCYNFLGIEETPAAIEDKAPNK
jgi:hypothetical protein